MKLTDPADGKEYKIKNITYENKTAGVKCGICEDENRNEFFIKITDYGQFREVNKEKNILNIAEEEARTLKIISKCSSRVPVLYSSWDDRAAHYFVIIMKKMPGISMRLWMKRHPAENLDAKDVFVRTQLILQICTIMRDINRQYPALVHRDLKPENIFISLDKEFRWKIWIIDFGCANLNYVRNVGTVGYQAPEQTGMRGCTVNITPRTDIFAIGQIYYEILTGNVPLIGKDYKFRSGNDNWSVFPELPYEILRIPGTDKINNLLKRMTAFRAEDRIIYNRLIAELKRIKTGKAENG